MSDKLFQNGLRLLSFENISLDRGRTEGERSRSAVAEEDCSSCCNLFLPRFADKGIPELYIMYYFNSTYV
jgi:hypothetical protein